MEYVPAKHILIRNRSTEWFGTDHTVNLYRGCCHGCIYFEKELELTRKALMLLDAYGFGVAVATKSDLIARDMDQPQRQTPVGGLFGPVPGAGTFL